MLIERCLWDEAAQPRPSAESPPPRTDVAIVGAGYTGLSAARTLARQGVAVTVLERHRTGWGASGRNGGFVLPGFQPDVATLIRRYGVDRAGSLFASSREAVDFLERLIADEAIDCEFARRGGITLAGRPAHLRRLADDQRLLWERFGHDTTLLGPEALRGEIDSPAYHGGLLDPAAGGLHPGRYCAGLARAAVRAGAVIVEGVEVTGVRRANGRSVVSTSAGPVSAGEVLVATNGYTDAAFPALQRRVVPVGSYIVATAPLGESVASRMLPGGRVMSDTWNLLHYFRLGGGRLIFGGRASFTPTTVRASARILQAAVARVFPSLGAVPIEFAWAGQVAFARDRMPHAGRLAGVHYALAYAGHGVALATWMGARMGDALAGRAPMPALTGDLPGIPLYRGRPWFLPLVGGYYRLKDWMS